MTQRSEVVPDLIDCRRDLYAHSIRFPGYPPMYCVSVVNRSGEKSWDLHKRKTSRIHPGNKQSPSDPCSRVLSREECMGTFIEHESLSEWAKRNTRLSRIPLAM